MSRKPYLRVLQASPTEAARPTAGNIHDLGSVDCRLLLESGLPGHFKFPDVVEIGDIGSIDIPLVVSLIGPDDESVGDRRVILAGRVIANGMDPDVIQVTYKCGVDIALPLPDHHVVTDIENIMIGGGIVERERISPARGDSDSEEPRFLGIAEIGAADVVRHVVPLLGSIPVDPAVFHPDHLVARNHRMAEGTGVGAGPQCLLNRC